MYSLILFLMTFAQTVLIVFSYVVHSQTVFTNVVIYGSPLYMISNLLGRDSAFFEKNPIYIGFALFHLIKYLCFCRSQMTEERNFLRNFAIIMEAAYLGLSAYYSL